MAAFGGHESFASCSGMPKSTALTSSSVVAGTSKIPQPQPGIRASLSKIRGAANAQMNLSSSQALRSKTFKTPVNPNVVAFAVPANDSRTGESQITVRTLSDSDSEPEVKHFGLLKFYLSWYYTSGAFKRRQPDNLAELGYANFMEFSEIHSEGAAPFLGYFQSDSSEA